MWKAVWRADGAGPFRWSINLYQMTGAELRHTAGGAVPLPDGPCAQHTHPSAPGLWLASCCPADNALTPPSISPLLQTGEDNQEIAALHKVTGWRERRETRRHSVSPGVLLLSLSPIPFSMPHMVDATISEVLYISAVELSCRQGVSRRMMYKHGVESVLDILLR